MVVEEERDDFDRLGSAAARVLRAALSGAADIRAVNGEVDDALRELERAVAKVLREAHRAADELVARAERTAVGIDVPSVIAQDVRLIGSSGSTAARGDGTAPSTDVQLRKLRRRRPK